MWGRVCFPCAMRGGCWVLKILFRAVLWGSQIFTKPFRAGVFLHPLILQRENVKRFP